MSLATHLQKDIMKRVELDDNIDNKEAVYYHCQKALKYLHNPFKNIHTKYKQKRFLRTNWSYVDASAVVLGHHLETRTLTCGPQMEEIPDLYFHVPLLQSIKQYLSNDQVCNMVLAAKSTAPEGYLIDFWDGSVYKQHPMLSKMDNCDENEAFLGVQLYYDDVEVCNPLTGNSHNVAMFYYRLANVDPLYRSMLPAMRLVGALETKHLKQYGMDTVLEHIVGDLRILHDVSITSK